MSAGPVPCTVSAEVASTLALACSVDATSPRDADDVTLRRAACTVRWQRLSPTGRYSNVTSSSGRYSAWKLERPATVTLDGDHHDVVVLQIDDVQRDDFTRSAACENNRTRNKNQTRIKR